jgi:hypothetical protein
MLESSGSLLGVIPRPLKALPAPGYSKAPSGTFDIGGGKNENQRVKIEKCHETTNYKREQSTQPVADHAIRHPQVPAPYNYHYQTYHPTHPVHAAYMQQHQWSSSDTADHE